MPTAPDPRPPGRGTIFRDDFGVPHLWADTVDDLAYVQGWEAAYERAWQLEYGRLRAEGRTAALLGSAAVEWDVFARRARIVDTARRAYDRLDARTRSWCAAYVEGVNDALPLGAADSAEFAALGATPGRWSSWSPLAVFAGIHILFGTCQYKLWRAHVAATLGAEFIDLFDVDGGPEGGSNAYAVTGPRSPTGLPLVAGDPHRYLEAPNAYQQVRLACPAFDVVGLAFPGVPGIAHFGHAGAVAWATTNAMADYQDLYLERLGSDPETGPWVAGPRGREPVERRFERIEVRDGEAVRVEAVETARGPVVLELADGRCYSLRTPSRVTSSLGFGALLPLLHARDVDDVTAAMTGWVEPVNALVIADATGRLREQVVGLVPERSPANRVLPADGADPAATWTGDYGRPGGRDGELVVNGNDAASGAGLGYDYAAPQRAARIRYLVERGAAFDAAGLAAVSLDTDQPAAGTLRMLLSDPSLAARLGPAAAEVRDRLLGWDGRADAASSEAALFAAWRSAFVRWLLDQPALAPLTAASGLPDLFARWVEPVARAGAAWERLAGAADRLRLDVRSGTALALDQVAGAPPTAWGDTHRYRPLHPLAGRPGAPEVPAAALSGDYGCVLAARSQPGVTDACTFGPVARYLWDLTDRDRSRWVVPLGSSARSSSPHRTDQLDRWAGGETIPIVTAWQRLRLDRVLPPATARPAVPTDRPDPESDR
ncbi:penicillin acylase family protein [Microlunatus ginsengisoli]|uniref:Penicillin amidase n=1 Tax=Microlunatus ginsengisoli TaxID=363863 RepID=A0ABP7A0Y3_9ACTN